MGRPTGSEDNKIIGLFFAKTVKMLLNLRGNKLIAIQVLKKNLKDASKAVARSGFCSVFAALARCCPSAVRNEDPFVGRYGLTEMEYNKLLERHGFRKVRARKSIFKQKQVAEKFPTGMCKAVLLALMKAAVRYLFAGCCWKNPRNEEDKKELENGWQLLAASSVPFKAQCSLGKFLSLCQEFHDEWDAFNTGFLSCRSDVSSPMQSAVVDSDSDTEGERPTKRLCSMHAREELECSDCGHEKNMVEFVTTCDLPMGMQHLVDVFDCSGINVQDPLNFDQVSEPVNPMQDVHDFCLEDSVDRHLGKPPASGDEFAALYDTHMDPDDLLVGN